MRKLIGLLLALNLGMLVTGMALQAWEPDASAPLVFNADKIQLLSLPESSSANRPPAKQVVAEDDPAPAAVLPELTSDVASAEPADLRCMTWSSLDATGLRKVEGYLAQAGVASGDYDVQLEKSLGWWVYLPPPEKQTDLQALLDEVHRLGIADFAVVRGGAMRNAVSLGAFGKLAQARLHVATMARKGLNGVQYGPRPDSGPVRLVFADSLPAANLVKLQAEWPKASKPALCSKP
mgnify:CR=1 FL=1|jgi:hypothetical protein